MKDNQFYPTPSDLAEHAAGLFKGSGGLLLEPSAGHGDLLKGLDYGRRHLPEYKVKCVEIDPDNVAILKDKGYDVIQADFLATTMPRIYDAVLMNPPFNAGVKHILKAWSLLKQGGELVAIVNKSALDNDFSAERKMLNSLIEKHGEYMNMGRAFDGESEAERKSRVECAIVYMKRHEYEDDGINTTEGLDKGPEMRIEPDQLQEFGMIKADFISAAEDDYQRGISAVFEGLKHMETGWKVLNARFGSAYDHNVLSLDKIFEATMEKIANRHSESVKMETVKGDLVAQIRALAWLTVLEKTEVKNLLYSQDQEEFINQVLTDSRGISFTKQNIVGFVHNIFMKRKEIFNGAVKKLFIELRRYHDRTTFHTEGWKTNKSWKVPEKIILPYGVTYDSYSGFSLRSYRQDYIDDLDRIIRVLDGKPPDFCKTIKDHLRDAFHAVKAGTRDYRSEVETEYFTLKFFKKGTLHITFKNKDLLAQINVIGVDGSNDIPDMNS